VEDVKRAALKKLIVEAAKLNKKKPIAGMKVEMNKRRRSKEARK